ncbi:hypothetical protein CONLIGDRAFT_681184 [Coniochaeta ligniaria NRRL 30616]|uniref:F-box domain-containing protein n=1 Tax=Coniochaeta ligniaria NRRL 30616 TaxID=1408157 RepID=A0A1J7IL74_9PEZI|nr:hypothetical protein CONLIGDRAFT_681184 [Coniochaeta ligniaria NRRL 30616]
MHLFKHRRITRTVVTFFRSIFLRTAHGSDTSSPSPTPDIATPPTPPSHYQRTTLNNSQTVSQDTLVGSGPDHDALDPLVTASIHNYRSSILYRLPEEIFLLILDQIRRSDDNIITYFCLRRVSRLFRRLVHADPTFLKHAVQATESYGMVRCALAHPNHNLRTSMPWFRERFDVLPDATRNTLCRYLRKDQICPSCLKHCELNGAANGHSGKIPYGSAVWTGCKFRSWSLHVGYGHRHCWACMSAHPTLPFSPSQASLKKLTTDPGRVCIGREGCIRLCQHMTVTWSEVERLMVERRGDGPGYYNTRPGEPSTIGVAEGPPLTWNSRGPSSKRGDLVLMCQDCSHGCSSGTSYLDASRDQVTQGLHSSSASALLETRLSSASVFDQMVLQFEAHKMMGISQGKLDSLQMRCLFDEIRQISPSWTAPDGTPWLIVAP